MKAGAFQLILSVFLALAMLTLSTNAQVSEEWVARYNGAGNGADQAKAVTTDSDGNVYVAGSSLGSGSGNDYVTIKYNSAGVIQWTSVYNGPVNNADMANAITVDAYGNVYVTGYSVGIGSEGDYCTIKYNSNGAQQWIARYNGPINYFDEALAIALDGQGNVYVTGHSYSSIYYDDYCTIKYNSNGGQLWVNRYNGPSSSFDAALSIAIDPDCNVYITGYSTGAYTLRDYCTIKYSTNGAQLWIARYNNPNNTGDEAQSLAIDEQRNVYVTGRSYSSSTGFNVCTIKYNENGIQQWLVQYNGPGNGTDDSRAVALGPSGNIYICGTSITVAGNGDFLLIKYNSSGQQQWLQTYNGSGNGSDDAVMLKIDIDENIYITGNSAGQGTSDDYATIKYNSNGMQQWIMRYNGPGLGSDFAKGIALDNDQNVIVTGYSDGLPGSSTNNDYATIKYAQPETTGIISGYIRNSANQAPIEGASVTASGLGGTFTDPDGSDQNGFYQIINVTPGTYSIVVSATGYSAQYRPDVTVVSGQTSTQDFALRAPIEFPLGSGILWDVRPTETGHPGWGSQPGEENQWSISEDNVWIDESGKLHLKITQNGSIWNCAEVTTQESFGYGEYVFWLNTRVDLLDQNVVAGLFTRQLPTPPFYFEDNELDIEFSTWNNTRPNSQYVVWGPGSNPYTSDWDEPFTTDLNDNIGCNNSTSHRIKWSSNSLNFRSLERHYLDPPPLSSTIADMTVPAAVPIPQAGDEKVHLNLWLTGQNHPYNNQPAELVISNFFFFPGPLAATGNINGCIRNGATGLPIQGAAVSAAGQAGTFSDPDGSDQNGNYAIVNIPAGTHYMVTVTATGYETQYAPNAIVKENQVSLQNIYLTPLQNPGLVTVQGNHFVVEGTPFYYGGSNTYYLMEKGADPSTRPAVLEVLDEMVSMWMTVLRTWGFHDGAGPWALQIYPGVYQEPVFQGLDYVLEEARQRGLRVILTLVNNWNDWGGMNQYVNWSSTATPGQHDQFYTDGFCRQYYMDYIDNLLNRVNTSNHRIYKADPTIFAWELANEPHCEGPPANPDLLQQWLSDMSGYIKSQDPWHMVTTGSEGFYGPTGPAHNPVLWFGACGVDFINNHSLNTVDFACFHLWPDNPSWNLDLNTSLLWVIDHLQDAQTYLDKPVILEEYGKLMPAPTRNLYFNTWLDAIYNSAQSGGTAAGSNLWMLADDGYFDPEGYAVYYPSETSTITILKARAILMSRLPQASGIQVTVSPVNPPIFVPASGGSFSYNLLVTNTGSTARRMRLWCNVTLPNGSSSVPTLGPLTIDLGAGQSLSRLRSQYIPANLPAGTYAFNAFVGESTDNIWDISIFQFWKEGNNQDSDSMAETSGTDILPENCVFCSISPNPFNPVTTLRFGLPQAGNVKLAIFNLLGQKVVTLVDGYREAGYHDLLWDAQSLPSGLYFCRLQARDFTAVKKMVLVK